jgi:hypothetical protein
MLFIHNKLFIIIIVAYLKQTVTIWKMVLIKCLQNLILTFKELLKVNLIYFALKVKFSVC